MPTPPRPILPFISTTHASSTCLPSTVHVPRQPLVGHAEPLGGCGPRGLAGAGRSHGRRLLQVMRHHRPVGRCVWSKRSNGRRLVYSLVPVSVSMPAVVTHSCSHRPVGLDRATPLVDAVVHGQALGPAAGHGPHQA